MLFRIGFFEKYRRTIILHLKLGAKFNLNCKKGLLEVRLLFECGVTGPTLIFSLQLVDV